MDYTHFVIYIDKKKEQIFVPYLRTKDGIWKVVDHWKYYTENEWEEISCNVLDMVEWLIENKDTEAQPVNVLKMKGVKNFKSFSSKHLCLVVLFFPKDKKFEIYNHPRLADGSYGIETDIPQEYWQQHICGYDLNEIKQSIECAYEDGMRYLAYIGKTL